MKFRSNVFHYSFINHKILDPDYSLNKSWSEGSRLIHFECAKLESYDLLPNVMDETPKIA